MGSPLESSIVHDGWSHSLKKSGTEPTAPPSAPGILQLASFAMWTIDWCLSDPSWDYEICFANFLHPEFYGHPSILETEAGPGVLGLLHRVRTLCPSLQPSARLQPGHGAILRITSGCPTFGFCFTTISGRQMCTPCTRTNASFAALHRLYRTAGFTESDLTTAAKPIRQYLHVSSLW